MNARKALALYKNAKRKNKQLNKFQREILDGYRTSGPLKTFFFTVTLFHLPNFSFNKSLSKNYLHTKRSIFPLENEPVLTDDSSEPTHSIARDLTDHQSPNVFSVPFL